MNEQQIKNIVEAALLAAGRTLGIDDILSLFEEREQPERDQIRDAIKALQEDYEGRSIEIKQVASGYRIQVRNGFSEWISRLWSERPSRYSRALLETLALIAYRQPITRGEIEDIRGVSVSSTIIKTMQERDWIRVLGHRDVPGKPAMYGTTKQFLDYFNLKSLDELPTLEELRDLDQINAELDLDLPDEKKGQDESGEAEADSEAEGLASTTDEETTITGDERQDAGDAEMQDTQDEEAVAEGDQDAQDEGAQDMVSIKVPLAEKQGEDQQESEEVSQEEVERQAEAAES